MLVPKLRFKEFKNNWNKIQLGKLGEFKNGISKSKKYFGHGNKLINLQDVFGKNCLENDEYSLVETTQKEIEEFSLKKRRCVIC